jgi:F-type H+-transporting ATPase subunit b
MPQLDASTYTSQLFWVAICFSVLYILLKIWVIPKFNKIIQNRWDHTGGMESGSGDIQLQAEELNSKREARIEEAKNKSLELISEATKRTRLHVAEKRAEFSDVVQKRLSECKKKLEQEEINSNALILDKLSSVVIESVEKSSGGVISRDDIERKTYHQFSLKGDFDSV